MRSAFFAALVLGAAAALSNAPAQAGERAFCIKGDNIPDAHGDCSFDTYEQCLASASGLRRYCDANPFYMSYAPGPEPRRHRHRRHHHHHRS
ncbi:MAG: DUF3551 domain-containing protein [Rhizobiales bacterium]|jgi:hypothetical protein|nr:DUF3551 domain-containing protein [Hyphomicrobiales bacterium]